MTDLLPPESSPEGSAPNGPATQATPTVLTGADEAPLTYEDATRRIEDIVGRLDSGDAGLRETLELCQEARRLVLFCASELDAVSRGLDELRLDELGARLTAPRSAG